MPDWAVCAECSTRYEALPFCPRCGSKATRAADGPRAEAPAARSPSRMRVQLGGVLLLIVGGLFLASSSYYALDPADVEGRIFHSWTVEQGGTTPAGTLRVTVLRAGDPVAGADVVVTASNLTLASNATDAAGQAVIPLGNYPAVVVNVTYEGATWTRRVLAPSGFDPEVVLDLATDAPSSDRVLGAGNFHAVVIIASFVISLMMVLGGLAAALMRWRGLALAGPLPVVVLALLLAMVFLNGYVLLMAGLIIGPYALVVSGRAAFRR